MIKQFLYGLAAFSIYPTTITVNNDYGISKYFVSAGKHIKNAMDDYSKETK